MISIGPTVEQLASPVFWIGRVGAVFAAVLGILLFAVSIPNEIVIGAYIVPSKWLAIFGAAFGLLSWWVLRSFYWRLGRGERIAVAVQTLKLPLDEVAMMNDGLTSLARSTNSARIRIKFIPHTLAQTHDSRVRLRKRYGFASVIEVNVSPHQGAPTGYEMECAFTSNFQGELQQKLFGLWAATVAKLFGEHADVSDYQKLANRQYSLLSIILLKIGLQRSDEREYSVAGRVFKELDQSLSRCQSDSTDPPRVLVRHLGMACLTCSGRYKAGESVGPSRIAVARQDLDLAEEWLGSQFVDIYIVKARLLFIIGEFDLAAKAVERAKQCLDASKVDNILTLDSGVIALFADDYKNANQYLSSLLLRPNQVKLDWHDLKDYADHLADQGHANACVLQALYRSAIRGETISAELRTTVMNWLAEKPSRQILKPLIAARFDGQFAKKVSRTRQSGRRNRK